MGGALGETWGTTWTLDHQTITALTYRDRHSHLWVVGGSRKTRREPGVYFAGGVCWLILNSDQGYVKQQVWCDNRVSHSALGH